MDEPTASLDARAEHALFSSVRDHAVGRSILMITHRLVSTRTADQIYVLDHGRVSEQGTHDELLASGGQYAELYSLQASQYAAPSPSRPARPSCLRLRDQPKLSLHVDVVLIEFLGLIQPAAPAGRDHERHHQGDADQAREPR